MMSVKYYEELKEHTKKKQNLEKYLKVAEKNFQRQQKARNNKKKKIQSSNKTSKNSVTRKAISISGLAAEIRQQKLEILNFIVRSRFGKN